MEQRQTILIVILAAVALVFVLAAAGTFGTGPEPGGTAGIPNPGTAIPALQGRPGPEHTGTYHTRLVLLGTTGGVSWWPGTDRASSSSALVVGDTIYLIDMGQGSASRLTEAFNEGDFVDTNAGRIENGSSVFLNRARALFITHLHIDHTADYPSLLLIGPGAGLGTAVDPATGKTVIAPLKVFGPASRGQLDADRTQYVARGGHIVTVDSADPGLDVPTPGLRQMTNSTFEAFAQTINDMTLDNGYRDYTRLFEVHEIGGRAKGDIPLPVAVPDPNNGTCPAMDPFEVYQDANVRVTATLVDHHQVFPALAYRFDTADGSVVFSGDTGKDTNGNLQKLANGSDILVHEVIDPAWIELKFGDPAPGSQMAALKTHMLTSHTAITDAGSVAESCHVKTLVLNHIVPGNTPESRLRLAQQNFTGKVIVGEDLAEIGIGKAGS
jgi:ribonuclease BN (tRNA processing enzyme)